jgi:DMSO/TMAO reductase YedYZ molybdopterin-dependent catalytic subunit
VLASGIVWAYGGDINAFGYGLLNWHFALGAVLGAIVLVHAAARAKPPRRRDLLERRQLLAAAGVGAFAVVAWRVQKPLASLLGWRGADRRFTGSYEVASFTGNDFPATSWVADDPRPLDAASWRLRVGGLVERELALSARDLDGLDRSTATLDCTGGFYSTQRWGGCGLARVLDRARPRPGASHVRVVSVTGYRWTFPLDEARRLLLATTVGDEPLSHAHGAPLRLVAPGRRGFEWVKWIERLELTDGPDPGAVAATIWSSFTAEGRGRR